MELKKAFFTVIFINLILLAAHFLINSTEDDINFQKLLLKRTQYHQEQEIIVEDQEQPEEIFQWAKPDSSTKLATFDIQNYFTDMMKQISLKQNETRNDKLQNTYQMRSQTTMGLIKDPNTCDFNNFYMKLQKPNTSNILTNFEADSIFRNSITLFGKDCYSPHVSDKMDIRNQQSQIYPVPYNATLLFMKNNDFHYHFKVGKEFLCEYQFYNQIPDSDQLYRRDYLQLLANSLNKKNVVDDALYESKEQNIFNYSKGYALSDAKECKQFFDLMDSKYYLKMNKSELIFYSPNKTQWNSQTELRLRRKYENGNLCGQIVEEQVVQFKLKDGSDKEQTNPLKYSIQPGLEYFIKNNKRIYKQNDFNISLHEQIISQVSVLFENIKLFDDPRLFQLLRADFVISKSEKVHLDEISTEIESNKEQLEKQIQSFYKLSIDIQSERQKQFINRQQSGFQ